MSLWKRIYHSIALAGLVLLPAAAPSALAQGQAARVISVHDNARLHLANPNSASNTLIEEGNATGTLPGRVRASLTIGTSTVKVGFTIYLPGGSITGHGTASFNPGQGEYASFGGSIAVNHGGGRYAHAAGSGRVYGSINRNTDNATVQVIGQLHA